MLITGAPDVIFAMCREQMSRHGAVPFEAQYWKRRWRASPVEDWWMVAAACKPASLDATTLNHEDLQEGLIFLGIGDDGSPRPEAIDAIHACQTAGIRVKMITGDHPQTAMSIGQMLGITNSSRLDRLPAGAHGRCGAGKGGGGVRHLCPYQPGA